MGLDWSVFAVKGRRSSFREVLCQTIQRYMHLFEGMSDAFRGSKILHAGFECTASYLHARHASQRSFCIFQLLLSILKSSAACQLF